MGRLFEGLVALQARLRAPNGCPWDREQTPASLRPFLLEEAYEVLDALDRGDPRKVASELGDLLLQVVFHAQLGREAGRFDISDVLRSIHAKLVRRHPHVFGNRRARTAAEVLKNWEELKTEERGSEMAERSARSILEGVPRSLPALLEAYQLTRRAANVGFDWDDIGGLLEKLREEAAEVRRALRAGEASSGHRRSDVEEEVGDLLFVAVNIARFLGVEPESALKKANRKFLDRFQWMERAAARGDLRLVEMPRQRMEELWNKSKEKA